MRAYLLKGLSFFVLLLITFFGFSQEVDNSEEFKLPPASPQSAFELLTNSWKLEDSLNFDQAEENELLHNLLQSKLWNFSIEDLSLNYKEGKDDIVKDIQWKFIESGLAIELSNSSSKLNFSILMLSQQQLKLFSEESDITIVLSREVD